MLTLLLPVVGDHPAQLLESAGSVLAHGGGTRLHVLLGPDTPACLPVAAALVRRDESVTWQQLTATTAAGMLERALPGVATPFCGVLGLGDQLLSGALAAIQQAMTADGPVDLVYTDEQWTGGGPAGADGAEPGLVVRLKPRLSPHYLETNDYPGRLAVYRVAALRRAGGWRADAGAAVEWDAALRVSEQLGADRAVEGVPVTAVHRRTAPPEFDIRGSRGTPGTAARASGRAAVEAHLARLGQPAEVTDGPIPGFLRVRRSVPDPPPLVSIVIPTVGAHRVVDGVRTELVSHCLAHLESSTSYPAWQVHLVISHHAPPDLESRLTARHDAVTATRLPPGPFNFSTSVNTGVAATDGPLVLLLNDDVIPLREDWLDVMVAAAMDGRTGVVGAKLLDDQDLIQHAGVIHDDAFHPSHVHRMEVDGPGHFGSLAVATDYSAVTAACLLTPRAVFEQVGGFAEELGVAYGDVDYCWKVGDTGRWCVMAPDALLRHYESSSRDPVVHPAELELYLSRWGDHIQADIGVQFRTVKTRPVADGATAGIVPGPVPGPVSGTVAALEVEAVGDDAERADGEPQHDQ